MRLLHKGIVTKTLIGCYEFDLSWVYFKPKHAILHKWVALSNLECPKFNEVAAYIKLSISVTTLGDEQL